MLSKQEKKTEQVKEEKRPEGDYYTTKNIITNIIDKSIDESRNENLDLSQFLKELKKEGLKFDFTYRNKTISEITFEKENVKFTASELGNNYSLNKLIERIDNQKNNLVEIKELKNIIDKTFLMPVDSLEHFAYKLDLVYDVKVNPYKRKGGGYGFSFEKNGVNISASKLFDDEDEKGKYSMGAILERIEKSKSKREFKPKEQEDKKDSIKSLVDDVIRYSPVTPTDVYELAETLQWEHDITVRAIIRDGKVKGLDFKPRESDVREKNKLGDEYSIKEIENKIAFWTLEKEALRRNISRTVDSVLRSSVMSLDEFSDQLKKEGIKSYSEKTASGGIRMIYEKEGIKFRDANLDGLNSSRYSYNELRETLSYHPSTRVVNPLPFSRLSYSTKVSSLRGEVRNMNKSVSLKGIYIQLNALGLKVEKDSFVHKDFNEPIKIKNIVQDKNLADKLINTPKPELNSSYYYEELNKNQRDLVMALFQVQDASVMDIHKSKAYNTCMTNIFRGEEVELPKEFKEHQSVKTLFDLSKQCTDTSYANVPFTTSLEASSGLGGGGSFIKGLFNAIGTSSTGNRKKKKGDDWDDEDENTRTYGGFGL